MSYTKQNFTDGQVLTAAHMNHIEDGIAAVDCVSPTITATETATGVDLTITDANGTKKVSLKNGKDSTSGAGSGGTTAKSFKLMTLGDSITQLGTQDRGWVKYFIESTGCTLIANVAVNGAVLSDSSSTTYDGNPVQETQDNNVLGNQVQKIINNGYEAPDVILIAIGTNGGISISKDDIKNAYYNASGDLIALESVDRKTHAGAFRYASEKLHELYPDALIFWCAPIMGHQKKRPAQTAVTCYESLKTAVDFTGQLMIDTIHCGINGVGEKQNEAGEYLVDGLHPTIKGAKKIGYYNASVVKAFLSMVVEESGTTNPEKPETGEKTILTTKEYTKWSTNTPLANGYNLPFTPKVNMTLKRLRFTILSSDAATLRVVIYDTVESKDVAEVTADIVQNTTDGNEVNVTFDAALTAGRFYKIYVGAKSGSNVLYYPLVPDDAVVENEYFSISRDNTDDYHWKNGKIKYGGYVTFTV